MPDPNKKASTSSGWLGLGVLAAAAIGGFVGYTLGTAQEEEQNQRERAQQYRQRTNRVPIPPPSICVICREEIGPPMEQLPCGHMYHRDCILAWIKTNPDCPDCRHKLTSAQVNDYISRAS